MEKRAYLGFPGYQRASLYLRDGSVCPQPNRQVDKI